MYSQELLAAVEKERRSRSRNTSSIATSTVHYFPEDEDSDHVSVLALCMYVSFPYNCMLLGESGSVISEMKLNFPGLLLG